MRHILIAATVFVAAGVFFLGVGGDIEAQDANIFSLTETPLAKPEGAKSSKASVRESKILFQDGSLLRAASRSISFPLLDGKQYRARQTGSEIRGIDDITWRGKLEGSDNDVILTKKNGYLSGLIYGPSSVYEIIPNSDGHQLVELDQDLYPLCAGAVESSMKENRDSAVPAGGVDSGDRIDVIVLYTTSVRTSLGGDAQAQAFAQSAIDSANTTYINSKVRQRLRLVLAQATTFAETGSLSTELSGFRAAAETTNLRAQYNADLVALLSNSSDNCGIGYLGSAAGNTTSAYTVTSRTCAVGNLSFAHELGHNMGSQHNPESGSGAAYAYGYGHYVNGVFRTVMSYVDPCPAGCNRRPYFSNPDVMFSNLPTGIENARDNARSLNNMSDVIANYRYSGSSITMNNYNGGEFIPRLISRNIAWASDGITGGNVRIELSRDESTTWETLVASTPNDGSAPVIVTGRPTKKARLRITSIETPTVSDSSVRNIAIK